VHQHQRTDAEQQAEGNREPGNRVKRPGRTEIVLMSDEQRQLHQLDEGEREDNGTDRADALVAFVVREQPVEHPEPGEIGQTEQREVAATAGPTPADASDQQAVNARATATATALGPRSRRRASIQPPSARAETAQSR
jgi:hypothetical protein